MLSLGTSLTNRNAAAVLREAAARVAQGEAQVDCSTLGQVDSSAVAVMLALHRDASARGRTLSFVGVPQQLAALASLYGVDTLLALSPRNPASGPARAVAGTEAEPAAESASASVAAPLEQVALHRH
ncbi:NTP binding protein involved in toluene tolerance [Cupriavidus gilardii CR3]|uniref:STAS domain-containing protein n=1 Tax=Cupriavidus gilardii TaxID=82541 RepID=A0A849BG39_9BURK|nr:NTP binding protein involved in toluene tolerance [Cupriavidus gilardii CR3]KAB0595387.1 STAS domain-containing protein [Cupriavidus gilardii]NNH11567.1 STAS domain-containing protein [Cupriavidus gilardii]